LNAILTWLFLDGFFDPSHTGRNRCITFAWGGPPSLIYPVKISSKSPKKDYWVDNLDAAQEMDRNLEAGSHAEPGQMI